MHSKIKVGIAGYGVVGKKRGECISKNQNLELVAVCDRSVESTGKFENGIYYSSAIPFGGEIITQDITHRLRTSPEKAERIKHKYGVAKSALANDEKSISISGLRGRESQLVSERDISLVIEARLRDIFTEVKNRICKDPLTKKLNYGIVL